MREVPPYKSSSEMGCLAFIVLLGWAVALIWLFTWVILQFVNK